MNQHPLMNPQPRPSMVQPPPLQHLQQPPAPLPQMMMNPTPPQQQQQMMNMSYGMWPPPAGPMDRRQFNFRKPNSVPPKVQRSGGSGYVSGSKPLGPRNNWKGKKVGKGKEFGGRRIDGSVPVGGGNNVASSFGKTNIFGNTNIGVGGAYKPPSLNELQHHNRVKTRRFFNKKNFNNNKNNNNNYNRGKFAPRNTSSYIIRAKKSGGITELVSPCPVTPAILPTPIFSPSKEVLVDMAKEEWGVDGYGSMKGLIRLRSPGHEAGEGQEEEESDEGGGSSESDVEEHVEVERRLDQDLSRFEMIYPNYETEHNNILESRADDPDSYIAHLEEENLILKERLFLMERENSDLRMRLQFYERQNQVGEDVNEEVEESDSENDSDNHGDVHYVEVNKEEMFEDVNDATTHEESNRMQGVEAVEIDESIERQFDNVQEAEFQAVEKKEEDFEKQSVNVDKTECHIVESHEQVEDIISDIQIVGLKEQTNDIDSPNVKENNSFFDRPLGADLSMDDVAAIGKASIAESQASPKVSEIEESEKSIVGGD